MKLKINYELQDLSISLFQAADAEEENMIEAVLTDSEKMLSADFRRFYDLLSVGKIDFFHFETGAGVVHVFTRSARRGVEIQETHFVHLRDGSLAPASHKNINRFEEIETVDNITIYAA